MAKIYVTRKIAEPGISMLKKAGHKVEVFPKAEVHPRKLLLEKVKGKDAVLCLLTDKIDEAFLKAAGPQLKVVSNYAVGYNNFDVEALKRRGVKATNTPGVLHGAVAEHTFMLMQVVANHIVEADRFVRAGKYKGWDPDLFVGHELDGKTLGIVGLGQIGHGVARRAKGMGMDIIYYDIRKDAKFEKKYRAKYAKLDSLLKKADYVTLHVPLLPSTRHLIGAGELRMMKKTSYLINTSRGPVIDEKALVQALKRKAIAGAALDVYEHEPKLTPGLTKLDNVILTPHIASATVEARRGMAISAASGLLAVLEGRKPKNLIREMQ